MLASMVKYNWSMVKYNWLVLYAIWLAVQRCATNLVNSPLCQTVSLLLQTLWQCFPSHLPFIHNPRPDLQTSYDLNLMLSLSLYLHRQFSSALSWAGRALSRANIYSSLLFNDHYWVTFEWTSCSVLQRWGNSNSILATIGFTVIKPQRKHSIILLIDFCKTKNGNLKGQNAH